MAASVGPQFEGKMTLAAPDHEHFVQLMQALNPWLNQVVIVGGWAHRLFRLHPLSQHLEFSPLTTLDTDVAIPERLQVLDQDLHESLTKGGFKEEFLGEHRPPVTHYRLGEDAGGFYAEFLTPLIGGGENRGKPKATVRVAGVNSQTLRYLDLLLHSPWHVTLVESKGFPVKKPTRVQVPNGASYLAQKLLIHDERDSKERAKHIVYIHDTIQTFGRSLAQLRGEWNENVRPMLPAKAIARVTNSSGVLFGEVTDTIRDASIEAGSTGRNLPAKELRDVCYAGLKQIFV
jgi:Nucleotidyltransferase